MPGEAGTIAADPKTLSVKIRSHVNGPCDVLRLAALAVSAHSRVLDCRRASCFEGLRRPATGDDHAEGAPAGHLTAKDVKDAVSVGRPCPGECCGIREGSQPRLPLVAAPPGT